MKIYKTRPVHSLYRSIMVEYFEADTGKRWPFYQQQDGDKTQHFAVCPACNNPIQVIGLYEKTVVSEDPFAKHYPKSVPGLAIYNQGDYDCCPYAAPRTPDRQSRRRGQGMSDLGRQILEQICAEYDRVIYILEQDTGLLISDSLASDMLKVYLAEEGYEYRGASLMNVPWILGYMSNAHSLIYRRVKKDYELHQALAGLPDINFQPSGKDAVKIEPAKGYLSLSLCFIHHRFLGEGREYMKMLVSKAGTLDAITSDERDQVCLVTLEFDHDRYQRLIATPAERARRPRQTLNDLAQKMITPILGVNFA